MGVGGRRGEEEGDEDEDEEEEEEGKNRDGSVGMERTVFEKRRPS